jgi:hypothetical protein
MKAAQTRERMKKKMEAKHVAEMIAKANASVAQVQAPVSAPVPLMTDDEMVAFFSECDRAEKTPRTANRNTLQGSTDVSGDKKKKKKK